METPPTEDREPDAAPGGGLEAFLQAYWSDRDRGEVRPLAAYLEQFPGHELAIAEEFLALERDSPFDADDEEDGAPGPGLPLGRRDGRFGPYRLIREIGRGGQGEVYLAEDTRLKRKVALKILTTLGPMAETLLGRFRREAEVASRLDHPGVCTVFDAGDVRGVPYIAMRYVEGESLAIKIASSREQAMGAASAIALDTDSPDGESGSGRGEVLRVTRLFEQVARALHVAHRAGVIHRDIKPGNIMVTPDLEPVILDFGLARELDSDQPTLTVSGDLFGTPAYMSPEQLVAGRAGVDARTDIFSLGATLFECLTLERPFEGPTREILFQNILGKEAPDPRRHNPAVPPDLGTVVRIAMEKDRNHRYSSALELADDLRRVLDREPIHARPVGPLVRFRRWVQRNPALAAATVGLFLVLLAGLTISLVLLAENHRALSAVTEQKRQADAARSDLETELRRSRGFQLAYTASSLVERNPGLALLLAIEAAERAPGEQAGRALREALARLREERTLLGSDAALRRAAFSGDGTRLLAEGEDGRCRLWEIRTGKLLRELPGTWRFAATGDLAEWPGEPAFERGPAGTRIRHVPGGEPILSDPLGREARAVTASGDGRRLAIRTADNALLLVDGRTGAALSTLLDAGATVPGPVRFSADGGRLLAVRGAAGQVWRADDGRPVCRFVRQDPGAILLAAWSADGRSIATAGTGPEVVIRDAASGRETARLRGHRAEVTHVQFDASGTRVATASADATARVFEVPAGTEICVLRGHTDRVLYVAFDPEGRRLATASADETARVWSLDSARGPRRVATTADRADEARLDAGASRMILPSAAGRDRVDVVDPETGSVLGSLSGGGSAVLKVWFGPDGKRVVLAHADRRLTLQDIPSRDELARGGATATARPFAALGPLESPPFLAALSPDGRRLVALTQHGAELRDVESGQRIRALSEHTRIVTYAEFSPNGQRFATASDDGTARVWEAATGRPLAECRGHEDIVWPARFGPSGVRLLTASSDGTARIWEAGTGECRTVLEGHRGAVSDALFDPDGHRVLTISEDHTAGVWDAASGRRLLTLDHRDDVPTRAAVDPRGALAATAAGSTVRLWDLATGQRLAALAHEERVFPVVVLGFTADGRNVVSFARDGTLHCWLTDPLAEARRRAPRELTDRERRQFGL